MRILITGPESAGKSHLARQLAWATDGYLVAEYARAYLAKRNGQYQFDDLVDIWEGQRAAELASPADQLIFCDTGPLVIKIWSEVKFQTVAPAVHQAASEMNYDLIFLCRPDLPWTPDPLREAPSPAFRQVLFEQYKQGLGRFAHKTTVISGASRTEQAMSHLQERGIIA